MARTVNNRNELYKHNYKEKKRCSLFVYALFLFQANYNPINGGAPEVWGGSFGCCVQDGGKGRVRRCWCESGGHVHSSNGPILRPPHTNKICHCKHNPYIKLQHQRPRYLVLSLLMWTEAVEGTGGLKITHFPCVTLASQYPLLFLKITFTQNTAAVFEGSIVNIMEHLLQQSLMLGYC